MSEIPNLSVEEIILDLNKAGLSFLTHSIFFII